VTRRSVAAGVSPPEVPGSRSVRRSILSRGLPMNFPMRAIARIEPGSLTPALSRGERVSRIACRNTPGPHPCEPARLVLADAWLRPPKLAAQLLLLPPGEGRDEGRSLHSSRPGSWSISRSFLNRGLPMYLSMQAIARVELGSLTPALSRGERVSRPDLGWGWDGPSARPTSPLSPTS
jgi:hypothetical protein